jgi:hypothetical protein
VRRNGFHSHGLLEEAIKQQAPMQGSALVKSEGEFIEVIIQMFGTDCPLVNSHQPAFQERYHTMDPGEQIGSGTFLVLQDRDVVWVSASIQPRVAFPPIGMNHTSGFNHVGNEKMKAGRRGIGYPPQAYSSNASAIFLSGNYN